MDEADMEIKKKIWILMTKDRKMIAKGVPRNRYLIPIDNVKDNKRVITYSSKGVAEANSWGFYGFAEYKEEDVEAVEAELIIKIENR